MALVFLITMLLTTSSVATNVVAGVDTINGENEELRTVVEAHGSSDGLKQRDSPAGDDADPVKEFAQDSPDETSSEAPEKVGSSALPPSLAKATWVGAKLRQGTKQDDHDLSSVEEDSSPQHNAAMEDHQDIPHCHNQSPVQASSADATIPHNPPKPVTGCHWGATGCNKGTKIRHSSLRNSSAFESVAQASSASSFSTGAAKSSVNHHTSSPSSFAGSTAAAIEARVVEARGTSSSRRPLSTPLTHNKSAGDSREDGPAAASLRKTASSTLSPTLAEPNPNAGDARADSVPHAHSPPQGFQLTARIVTSPFDGLSYYLDNLSSVANSEEENKNTVDWMLTIPYTYVECGPTIESTTDAFLLDDMVVRHFPAGGMMGHWVNLAGGVTMEEPVSDEADTSGGVDNRQEYYGPSNLNHHDVHSKLLVVLSPIEITVSGNDEETRLFDPGDVILMEDTLGKGHKMRAAPIQEESKKTQRRTNSSPKEPASLIHGQDLSVLMISLPHSVHYPLYGWDQDPSSLRRSTRENSPYRDDGSVDSPQREPSLTPTYTGAHHSIFGFGPKYPHHLGDSQGKRQKNVKSPFSTKPCPLEYDPAYSSLFNPSRNQKRHQGRRKNSYRRSRFWGGPSYSNLDTHSGASPYDSVYPPPPGFSTYTHTETGRPNRSRLLLALLSQAPSLRRTMLLGLGLSLTSSLVYCIQLLYPPLLALLGGATVVLAGAMMSVGWMRWIWEWVEVWSEEWRWRREVKRSKKRREEARKLKKMKREEKKRKSEENSSKETVGEDFVFVASEIDEDVEGLESNIALDDDENDVPEKNHSEKSDLNIDVEPSDVVYESIDSLKDAPEKDESIMVDSSS